MSDTTEATAPIEVYKIWTWDVFGGGLLVMHFTNVTRLPSWRRRLLTRLLLGSSWTKHPKPPPRPVINVA